MRRPNLGLMAALSMLAASTSHSVSYVNGADPKPMRQLRGEPDLSRVQSEIADWNAAVDARKAAKKESK